MKRAWIFLLLSFTKISCALASTEDEFISKISSLIAIGDTHGARRVSLFTKDLYPSSNKVLPLVIRTLADDGYLKEAVSMLPPIYNDEGVKKYFSVLESIGWNYLTKEEGISSSSNIASMLGAYRTHDARCVALLLKKLNSSNAFDRHLAVNLSISYQDGALKKKILQMLKEEKNYFVRLKVMEACGKMRIKKSEKILSELLLSNTLTFDQRYKAIISLMNIADKPKSDQIEKLIKSPRTSMREYAVTLIDHFELTDQAQLLVSTLEDRHPSVRTKAIIALLSLNIDVSKYERIKGVIEKIIQTDVCEVSEIAKLLLLKMNKESAVEAFKASILGSDEKRARFSSRVIGFGGKALEGLLLESFHQTKDPIVKANLAIAMMGKNLGDYSLTSYLANFLETYENKLMLKSEYSPYFLGIDESAVRHIPYISNYPGLVDSMSRLHLLSKLAIIDSRLVRKSMKKFLKDRMWGVSSTAAIVMLEDCRLDDIALLEDLLDDEDPQVRLQAALVLAFYGNSKKAAGNLEETYKSVAWEKKIMILEALGSIGSRDSIPFLLERMKKETFIMQKIAAASLLQCLYH